MMINDPRVTLVLRIVLLMEPHTMYFSAIVGFLQAMMLLAMTCVYKIANVHKLCRIYKIA